jgi:capsular exopolysaccharide synthesis family protein
MTTLPQTNQARLPRPAGVLPAHVGGNGNGHLNGHGGPGGGQPGARVMTPGDVWRVIRGNLWLIFAFVFASAIAGYTANDYLARYHSRYTAHGYVSIQEPTVYDPQTHSNVTVGDFPGLSIEQRTQAMLIKNEALFTQVLQNPSSPIRQTGWYNSFKVPVKDTTGLIAPIFDSVAAKTSLDENFLATPVDQTNLIDISMTYSNPHDACEIVQAIVDEHLQSEANGVSDRETNRETVLNVDKIRQANKVKELQDSLNQKALDLNIDASGATDAMRFNTHDAEIASLVSNRMTLSANLLNVKTRLDKAMQAINSGQEPDGVEQAVSQDPDVRNYHEQIDNLDAKIKAAYQEGPNNPEIKGLQAQLDVFQEKLQEASSLARVNARTSLVDDLQSSEQSLQQQLNATDKDIQGIRNEVTSNAAAMREYMVQSDELARAREELAKTTADIEALNTQIEEKANGVQWETQPITPDVPSFPKLTYSMAIAVFLGLAISVGIAFLREMLDTTVRSPRDISRVGSLTLLGMIPHEDDDPQSAGVPLPMVIFQAPTSIMAEGFRQVRTRLQHAASLDTTRSMLVTSPSPGDGKSLVASNLAAGLALNGRRILLVDSNFRKPALDKNFGVDNHIGFGDVLVSLDKFDSAIHKTQVPNLDLMPTGPRPSNPTELLESQMLLDFIERSLEEYDHIIFDSGPMLLVSETAALAPRVDGVITVVRARTNSRGLLQRMRDNLRQLKAEHLGVVLNAVRSQGGGYYGRNIKTYYEYQNQAAATN